MLWWIDKVTDAGKISLLCGDRRASVVRGRNIGLLLLGYSLRHCPTGRRTFLLYGGGLRGVCSLRGCSICRNACYGIRKGPGGGRSNRAGRLACAFGIFGGRFLRPLFLQES